MRFTMYKAPCPYYRSLASRSATAMHEVRQNAIPGSKFESQPDSNSAQYASAAANERPIRLLQAEH